MRFNVYTRTNQVLLEGIFIACSLVTALLLSNNGLFSYNVSQLLAIACLVIGGREIANLFGGVHRIQWRYISIRDAARIAAVYVGFSCVLLLLRFVAPAGAVFLRLPLSVIVIELLLSAQAAIGMRILRRYAYERRAPLGKGQDDAVRRVVLVGAGLLGSRVARQLSGRATVKIVGFLDDDPYKIGCFIAGTKVLGPTTLLSELVRTKQIDDLLICIGPDHRDSLNRLLSLAERLPVRCRFVPTMEEILSNEPVLDLVVGGNGSKTNGRENGNGNGHGAISTGSSENHTPFPPINGATIVITGGAGFIGSSLAARLVDQNQIILVDRIFDNAAVSYTPLLNHPNVRVVEADIMNGVDFRPLAREADYVVHAAAIVGVGRVCNYPRETMEVNFVGTSRVLRAFEKSPKLKRFIYFSTSEVFGVNSFRVDESSPSSVGPAAEARWSYAIAKLAGEHLVKAYHRETGMPVVTIRPFNVFGPRRVGSHAVLQFVLACLEGKNIEVHGDGSQIRSWCYIEDFCDALVEMLRRPGAIGEDFNIGNPKNTLTIYQLVQKIQEFTNRSVPVNFVNPDFPDVEIRVPSLEKARRVLGYKPKYDLDTALRLTVDWYKKNAARIQHKTERAAAIG